MCTKAVLGRHRSWTLAHSPHTPEPPVRHEGFTVSYVSESTGFAGGAMGDGAGAGGGGVGGIGDGDTGDGVPAGDGVADGDAAGDTGEDGDGDCVAGVLLPGDGDGVAVGGVGGGVAGDGEATGVADGDAAGDTGEDGDGDCVGVLPPPPPPPPPGVSHTVFVVLVQTALTPATHVDSAAHVAHGAFPEADQVEPAIHNTTPGVGFSPTVMVSL